MKIQILYFAQVSEKLGKTQESLVIPEGSSSKDLIFLLESTNPALIGLKYKLAMNQTLYNSEFELVDGAEIALLPPFAGG